jgi:hypothetical protein
MICSRSYAAVRNKVVGDTAVADIDADDIAGVVLADVSLDVSAAVGRLVLDGDAAAPDC